MFSMLIDVFCKSGGVGKVVKVFVDMKVCGCKFNIFIYILMIDGLGKFG